MDGGSRKGGPRSERRNAASFTLYGMPACQTPGRISSMPRRVLTFVSDTLWRPL